MDVEDDISLHRGLLEAVDKADRELKAYVDKTIMKSYRHDKSFSEGSLFLMKRVPESFGEARGVEEYRRRSGRITSRPASYNPQG